jgi:hypothetical protein
MLYYYSTWKIKNDYSQVSSVVKDFRICSKGHMMGETKPEITDSTAEINTQFVFSSGISYF